jgi:serine/threonine protein kinase
MSRFYFLLLEVEDSRTMFSSPASPPGDYSSKLLISHKPISTVPQQLDILTPNVPIKNPKKAGGKPYPASLPPSKVVKGLIPSAVYLAGGEYGVVFKDIVSMVSSSKYESLLNLLSNRVGDDIVPSVGSHVVVKIAKQDKYEKYVEFVHRMTREVKMHVHISRSVGKHPCTGQILIGHEIVPQLYFSGTYKNFHFTIMRLANGEPLEKYIKKFKAVPPVIRTNIEHAILTLWFAAGVVHADLHFGNIIVNKASGQVYIIDFGFAVLLPPHLMRAMENQMKKNSNAASAWYGSGVQPYLNAIYHKYPWYNPNGKALKVLANRHAIMSFGEGLPRREFPNASGRWMSATRAAMEALTASLSPVAVIDKATRSCSSASGLTQSPLSDLKRPLRPLRKRRQQFVIENSPALAPRRSRRVRAKRSQR